MKGRVAVVTGAAGGIGLACARRLAAAGCTVVATDLDAARTAAQVAPFGGHARALDVSDPPAVEAAADALAAEFGTPSLLVACAGLIPGPATPPDETDWSAWDRMYAVNVRGAFATAAAFGSRMARAGGGAMVLIGSLAGLRSTPLHAYGSGKAALPLMAQNLAAQWGRSGVRVNVVSPGYVQTETFLSAVAAGHRDAGALDAQAALGRMVTPDEIADAAAFLLSDAASAITGVTLPVDAGAYVAPSWGVYGGVPGPL